MNPSLFKILLDDHGHRAGDWETIKVDGFEMNNEGIDSALKLSGTFHDAPGGVPYLYSLLPEPSGFVLLLIGGLAIWPRMRG